MTTFSVLLCIKMLTLQRTLAVLFSTNSAIKWKYSENLLHSQRQRQQYDDLCIELKPMIKWAKNSTSNQLLKRITKTLISCTITLSTNKKRGKVARHASTQKIEFDAVKCPFQSSFCVKKNIRNEITFSSLQRWQLAQQHFPKPRNGSKKATRARNEVAKISRKYILITSTVPAMRSAFRWQEKSVHMQLRNTTINAPTEIISFVHEWQRISEIKYKFSLKSDYFYFHPILFFAPLRVFILFISSSVSHPQIAITFSVFICCVIVLCPMQLFDEIRQNTCLWGMLIPFVVECCFRKIVGDSSQTNEPEREKN